MSICFYYVRYIIILLYSLIQIIFNESWNIVKRSLQKLQTNSTWMCTGQTLLFTECCECREVLVGILVHCSSMAPHIPENWNSADTLKQKVSSATFTFRIVMCTVWYVLKTHTRPWALASLLSFQCFMSMIRYCNLWKRKRQFGEIKKLFSHNNVLLNSSRRIQHHWLICNCTLCPCRTLETH